MESLALVAEGSRVSSVARVKGHKEDTIVAWIREATQHAQAIEAELLKNFRIERGQLDAMWSYVGNKGEKELSRDDTKRSILAFDNDRYGHSAEGGTGQP